MLLTIAQTLCRQQPLLTGLAAAMMGVTALTAARMLARPAGPAAAARPAGENADGGGSLGGGIDGGDSLGGGTLGGGAAGGAALAKGRAWTTSAGIVLACGLWSSHVLTLLAAAAALPIYCDPVAIWLSLGVAIGGVQVGLHVARSPGAPGNRADATLGGAALGIAVAASQAVRLAAMRLPALPAVDPAHRLYGFLAAIALGAGALLALRRAGQPPPAAAAARLVLGGILLAALIAVPPCLVLDGVHLVPDAPPAGTLPLVDTSPVALAVATIGACVVALAAAVAVLDHRRGLRRREAARLRQLAEGTFEGILIHRDGSILDVNRALCDLLGRPASDLVGTTLLDHLPPDQVPRARQRLASGELGPMEIEINTARGPALVELLTRTIDYDGGPARMVAVRDLTERRAAEARIRHLAHHDSLTGLANRTLLQERLAQALAVAERHEQTVAVLGLDLDRFKLVNDLLGHEAGDAVLIEVARRLRGCVRGIDTIARVGGDEFVIVQPGIDDAKAAEALALRLLETVAMPYDLQGRQVVLGTSVGLALYPQDSRLPHELLKQADIALYRSKSGGRGTFRFFEPGMNVRLLERRQLEDDLRHAVPHRDLTLSYEPQVDCFTGAICGCEAVLRWHHPQRGELPAAAFMRVAEECGLIAQLGPWMLEAACRDALRWPPRLRLAVNLSPALLLGRELVQQVAGLLQRIGLPPARLEVEVTEGLLTSEPEQVQETLRGLKHLGVRLALDDFGTGPASLSALRRYPFDRLKIDGTLIAGIGIDRNATEIVRAILALAHALRLEVSAEGVETEAQLALLRAEGCTEVQGPLLLPPTSAEALADLLDGPAALADALI